MVSSGSTDKANAQRIASVTRRQFAALGSAALFAGSPGIARSEDLPVTETRITIATPVGDCTGYFVKPQVPAFAALAIWANSAGELASCRRTAESLATRGHAVLVVELPANMEPQALNRMSKAVAAWLASLPETAEAADDFALQSFSGAHGSISLASRGERRAAVQSAVLVTLPKALSRMPNSRETFAQLARSTARRLAA